MRWFGVGPKNVEELQAELNAEGFDPNRYTLWASDRNDNLCLEQTGNTWTVYYSERGKRHNDHSFESEAEACQYFLAEFEKHPRELRCHTCQGAAHMGAGLHSRM